MEPSLLQALLEASTEAALKALIQTQSLSLQTVAALKARSAEFYFDQPAEALRLAEAALRLGELLPAPAPALGRWALGNALLFLDRYQEAVEQFSQARALYLVAGMPLEAARMGVGQVGALAYTGRFEEALALAVEIEPVLDAAAKGDPQRDRKSVV